MAQNLPKALARDSKLLSLEIDSTKALCESFGTVRSLTVWLMLHYGEYEQLLDLNIDPALYDSPERFALDYQVTKVLSKNPRLPVSYDRSAVAIGKFRDAEALCRATNLRFENFFEDPYSVGADERRLFFRVQRRIERILGSHPSHDDLIFCEEKMRFGPGATTSLSGIVTQGKKYSLRQLECTSTLLPFRAFAFPELWRAHVQELKVVSASRLVTVPKNAKTDRVICIEPDLNIFVQLGIGALIRRKLRRFGLDLDTQDHNRALASYASKLGLATVDLAAASDTISYNIVAGLLPPAWRQLLEMARVPNTSYEGEVVELEKWSSMGNGYTFELETLIFYAVILSVVPEAEHVMCLAYGDDCILPASYLDRFVSALNFLGFKVNQDKTFGIGLFHESCGTDWFDGHEVRPFFLRSSYHDFSSVCYLYANNARRWSCRRNGGDSCDVRVLPFWLRCFTACPRVDRHLIPDGFGDVGFVTDLDRASPSRDRHLQSWRFKYRHVPSAKKVVDPTGAYLSFLNGVITDFSSGREALRGRHKPATTKVGHSNTWPNLGPWM